MDHPAPHESATSETPLRSREVAHQARRRRLMRVLRAVLLGCVVGASFTLASLPTAWSIVGRVLIPVPAFYIFLTVLLGKNPPLPFYAAFAVAGLYSALLTALSRDLSERPTRPRLGSSRAQHRAR